MIQEGVGVREEQAKGDWLSSRLIVSATARDRVLLTSAAVTVDKYPVPFGPQDILFP